MPIAYAKGGTLVFTNWHSSTLSRPQLTSWERTVDLSASGPMLTC